jgi:hypothetical protein
MEYIGRLFLAVFLARWAFMKFSAANPELASDLKQQAGAKAVGLVRRLLK